jgi:putative aldouronate transport system substrate-binding protein
MQYKFILGQVPLSDFDKYVEQLKKMNIQECIDRRQAAMERFNKR